MAPLRSRDAPARQHPEAMSQSWIEVGSRPSSSSRSSATDEIITTGLTVQHDSNRHRRNRRLQALSQFQPSAGPTHPGGSSSQEEFEESESESDRVMSSETMSERDEEEGDENATAVNYPRSTPRSTPQEFQPRPNAFSHANDQQKVIRPQSGTISTLGRNPRLSSQRQQSYPQHTPYNMLVPSYHPDHDEALRASLSTLLSAAAAVRGLPKPGQPRPAPPPSARLDPTSLHMVPESVALGDVSEEPSSPCAASVCCPTDKSKRKTSPPASSATRSSSKDRRAVKKARKTGPMIEEISPTLLTWVVSAGVVVLVSALSFSVGYVVGKEAGHAEAIGQMSAAGGGAGRCGKEAAAGLQGTSLGLRKLRWSGSTGIRA